MPVVAIFPFWEYPDELGQTQHREEVRGQLSNPALGWVDQRRSFQQGGAQGRWRRVAKPGSTRMRFWFHTTGASGLGEVLSSEANTPGCWPAGRSQMKATINGRRTFTFCESFLFVCFCSNRQCLKRNRLIWKCSPSYNKFRYLAFDCSGDNIGNIHSH